MVPDYLSSHFVFRSDTLTCKLRDSYCSLTIPQPRTNYCKILYIYSKGSVSSAAFCLKLKAKKKMDIFQTVLFSYVKNDVSSLNDHIVL